MEKIEELAEKLRREGIDKGQAEADKIIADARQQAEKIVAEARQQADAISQQAAKKAAELDANTKSELKLYMGQALNALKSEITNIVTDKIVAQNVGKLTNDADFIGKLTVAMATEWVKQGDIVISSANAAALKAYVAKEAKELLDKGVKIEQVNGLTTLFTVQPADGSYRVDFGREELESYFKGFLRPQLIEMLF
ncbi:MAG: hypothetical protein J5486_09530 [Bacteroidaceae bacterium]|nr:hypothetical protein [Bacteroidaceae bacterium]